MSDLQLFIDDQGRREPPLLAGDADTLFGYINFFRDSVHWKSSGLTDAQLKAQPLTLSMSIAGLLKHLAYVEDYWFSVVLLGNQPAEPWASVDWKANPEWEWETALSEPAESSRALWQDAIAVSDQNWQLALTSGLTLGSRVRWAQAEQDISLRWLLTHLIEEYGRHCGHLDILREEIDGLVGE